MRSEYLFDSQLDLILAALTPSNALVCKVILHTGLRISDALSLPASVLERKPCRFWVTERKTGKRKLCGLPADLVAAIREQSDDTWMFPGDGTGRPRTRQAVWSDIKAAQRAFRIPVNAGTHSMRKVYAVQLMADYGDISKVQKALNHSNSTITMLYAMADKLTQSQKKKGGNARPRKRKVQGK